MKTTIKSKRANKQSTEWLKTFYNNISDKALISRICMKTPTTQQQKRNNLIKKWTKNLNRHFFKGVIQMVNKRMKGCSTSLTFRNKNKNPNKIPLHSY